MFLDKFIRKPCHTNIEMPGAREAKKNKDMDCKEVSSINRVVGKLDQLEPKILRLVALKLVTCAMVLSSFCGWNWEYEGKWNPIPWR